MKYEDPACAYCPPNVRACRHGESEARGPGFCPTKVDPEAQAKARAMYDEPAIRKVSRESAVVESEGYCRWTRVEEIVQFAKRMGYRRIGIANCISFVDHAFVLSGILESHGFEVVSAKGMGFVRVPDDANTAAILHQLGEEAYSLASSPPDALVMSCGALRTNPTPY